MSLSPHGAFLQVTQLRWLLNTWRVAWPSLSCWSSSSKWACCHPYGPQVRWPALDVVLQVWSDLQRRLRKLLPLFQANRHISVQPAITGLGKYKATWSYSMEAGGLLYELESRGPLNMLASVTPLLVSVEYCSPVYPFEDENHNLRSKWIFFSPQIFIRKSW